MATAAENYSEAKAPAWLIALPLLAGSAIAAFVASNFSPHVLLHTALFAAGLALTSACSFREDVSTLVWAFVCAYLLRVAAILLIQYLAPGGLMFFDDRGYDEQARYLASQWSFSNLASDNLGTSHTGYPVLLGTLYGLLGPSILSAKFLNAFFGALTVPVTYRLALELCGRRNEARTAAWLTAVFPYDAMWAGFLLKDTVLLFLFTTLVLCLVRLGKTRRFGFLLAGFGLSLVLQRFRFYSIAVLLLAGLTGLAVAVTRRLFRSRHAHIAVAVLVLCIAIGGASLAAAHYGETVTALSVYARGVETVDAAGQTLLWFTPELGFVRDFLKAALVYQLGPFPWIFSGVDIGGTMFYPGMYLIYALFPFFLLGFTDLARELDGCRAFALSAWLLHALVEIFLNQSGGRQRIMVDALFICCAAAGWSRREGRASFVATTYALLLAFAAVHIAART